MQNEGWDPRVAARQYSQMLGSIAGFVVPAVILLFTVAPNSNDAEASGLTFAAGLLVLSLICCLLGAFGFASIGSQLYRSANTGPGTMWIGEAVLVGLISVLAAFAVLADLYLADVKLLFVMIVAGAAAAGVIFTMLLILDEAPRIEHPSLPGQWLQSDAQAIYWTAGLSAMGLAIIGVATILYSLGVRFDLSTTAANTVVGAGILLGIMASLFGLVRSLTPHGREMPLRRAEPLIAQAGTSTFLGFLIMSLP